MGIAFYMREVYSASDWFLQKLGESQMEELIKVCTVLSGIWWERNEKVWDNRVLTGAATMDRSSG